MIYNGKKIEDQKKAMDRLKQLCEKEARFEIIEKKNGRTLRQNSYLHLILGFFAIETGYTVEFVKKQYFKRLCNPGIFIISKKDPYLGNIQVLKSSRDIDTGEMTTAIQRFRNWSSMEAGIYLPEPSDQEFLDHIQNEIERHKEYL